MILTFMAQNLAHGARRGQEGESEDRWGAFVERANRVRPDFLLLLEANDWGRYGHRYQAEAMEDLDMDAMPLAPSPSGYGSNLFYRREIVGRWKRWNTDFGEQAIHGFGVSAFDVGLPSLLTVMPIHFAPFSADKAIQEASLVVSRLYRYGPFGVLGGDINFPPSRGPEPDYSTMRPYNVSARTLMHEPGYSGPMEPDRRVAWKLEQAGLVDVGLLMFDRTGDPKYLAPTASDDRIDRFYVTAPLAPGIVNCRHISESKGASDHLGVVIKLDTGKIALDTNWTYR